jgi:SanA protein
MYSSSDLSYRVPSVAIVFGAAIWKDNQPCPVLYDRIATAVQLYQSGKVKKLLLTGDNSTAQYNEPQVMCDLAVKLGVPDRDIILDFAGRNTFASCVRAKKIFGINEAIVVSQEFHLPRILYICETLGIKSIGVKADIRSYPLGAKISWKIRESMAFLKAWINLNFWHPQLILGEKITLE